MRAAAGLCRHLCAAQGMQPDCPLEAERGTCAQTKMHIGEDLLFISMIFVLIHEHNVFAYACLSHARIDVSPSEFNFVMFHATSSSTDYFLN